MTEKKHVIIVSEKEFDFLLAAARLWQSPQGSAAINQDLLDIATRGGEHDEFTMDEIDTLCERINTEQPTLYLGTYEHRHGSNSELYLTEEAARAAKDGFADEYWEQEIGDEEEKPTKNIGDRYFEYMQEHGLDEHFNILPLTPKS